MDIYQNTLFRDLEKLNFTLNESKVYLTLIKLGPSLAGKIAKEIKLDRSSTYNALNSLINKGIISTIYENQRTIYIPEKPIKIIDYYKEKEEVAKNIVSELEKQFSFRKQESSVKLYRGFKGLKTVFQDILCSCKKGDIYCVMATEGQFGEKMPYYAPLFRKLKEKKRIHTKMLIREGREKKTQGKFSEYRKVPSDVTSPATISIYKNKVAIFIWESLPQAILIENEDVSKTFENYFQFMWKHAKK